MNHWEAAKVDLGVAVPVGLMAWLTDPEKMNMLLLWGGGIIIVLRLVFMVAMFIKDWRKK